MSHFWELFLYITFPFFLYLGVVDPILEAISYCKNGSVSGKMLRYPWVIKNETTGKIEQIIILMVTYIGQLTFLTWIVWRS